jgi:hypothetical protein
MFHGLWYRKQPHSIAAGKEVIVERFSENFIRFSHDEVTQRYTEFEAPGVAALNHAEPRCELSF